MRICVTGTQPKRWPRDIILGGVQISFLYFLYLLIWNFYSNIKLSSLCVTKPKFLAALFTLVVYCNIVTLYCAAIYKVFIINPENENKISPDTAELLLCWHCRLCRLCSLAMNLKVTNITFTVHCFLPAAGSGFKFTPPHSEARVSEASLRLRVFSLHNEHSIVFAAATIQCTVGTTQGTTKRRLVSSC